MRIHSNLTTLLHRYFRKACYLNIPLQFLSAWKQMILYKAAYNDDIMPLKFLCIWWSSWVMNIENPFWNEFELIYLRVFSSRIFAYSCFLWTSAVMFLVHKVSQITSFFCIQNTRYSWLKIWTQTWTRETRGTPNGEPWQLLRPFRPLLH